MCRGRRADGRAPSRARVRGIILGALTDEPPPSFEFIRDALPPPPARVLEVGAGGGELATALVQVGYEVLAVDPEPQADHVVPVALHELREPARSFDAAVAVLSLHHVDPLEESCHVLAELVRPGGVLVVDEFDVERFDEVAAAWWLARRAEAGESHEHTPASLVARMREHLHPLARIEDALTPAFLLHAPAFGAYLYRWHLPPAAREAEERAIAEGRLPATGARFTAARR
ncbi:MAG TPA: class I SAM-dependent methyltransferase [Solirubrobacteraceae bacterium]